VPGRSERDADAPAVLPVLRGEPLAVLRSLLGVLRRPDTGYMGGAARDIPPTVNAGRT
jgi:hypothetical protein